MNRRSFLQSSAVVFGLGVGATEATGSPQTTAAALADHADPDAPCPVMEELFAFISEHTICPKPGTPRHAEVEEDLRDRLENTRHNVLADHCHLGSILEEQEVDAAAIRAVTVDVTIDEYGPEVTTDIKLKGSVDGVSV